MRGAPFPFGGTPSSTSSAIIAHRGSGERRSKCSVPGLSVSLLCYEKRQRNVGQTSFLELLWEGSFQALKTTSKSHSWAEGPTDLG